MSTITSRATVATDRPARYGKQLVSHLSRRSVGSWDEQAGTGVIRFTSGQVELTSAPDGLRLELTVDEPDVATMEDVVGRHLVRFGTRDELVVSWTRDDGTSGTEQRQATPDGPPPAGS